MMRVSSWGERVEAVRLALRWLMAEHGAPNRFHWSEVCERSAAVSQSTAQRVGRHHFGGFEVKHVDDSVVQYRAGWYEVGV